MPRNGRVEVLTACALSVKFVAVMQHTSGLRLNLRRCSAVTLFTSEISGFASVHRQRRTARDYIIAVLCFCFNANYTSLNSVSTSAFKALIRFC